MTADKAPNWLNRIGPTCGIVFAQLVAAAVTVLALSLIAFEQAQAAALSGAACILPTALFALCASRSRSSVAIVMAGALKSIAIVGLLVAAFIVAAPAPLGFVLGLVVTHLAYLAAPFFSATH